MHENVKNYVELLKEKKTFVTFKLVKTLLFLRSLKP